MGRKNSSVKVDSGTIEQLLKEQNQTKASIAKKIGYSREAVSKSISKGIMDIGMLQKLAEALDRYPAYLQGIYIRPISFTEGKVQYPSASYKDYSSDKKWAIREEQFTKFIKMCENEIKVRDIDLPSEYRNIPHNYGLTDFIKEYNQELKGIPAVYDADGMRLDETAYGYLAVEVIEYLHKFLAEIFVNNMKASEGDK